MWSNQTQCQTNVLKAKLTDWFVQPLLPIKPWEALVCVDSNAKGVPLSSFCARHLAVKLEVYCLFQFYDWTAKHRQSAAITMSAINTKAWLYLPSSYHVCIFLSHLLESTRDDKCYCYSQTHTSLFLPVIAQHSHIKKHG